MADIEIDEPLSIKLDAVDVELGDFPGIQFRYAARGSLQGHWFLNEGHFSISDEAIARFTEDLETFSTPEAIFSSIDAEFVIHIKKQHGIFEWRVWTTVHEDGVCFESRLLSTYVAPLRRSHLAKIIEAFRKYPE